MTMDTKKIIQALAYMAYKEPNHVMDNIKAYKLLWLADRYHVRRTGRLVTGDAYYAMPKGPVPSDAKNLLEGQATHLATDDQYLKEYIKCLGDKYEVVQAPNGKVFSISDREAMDLVYNIFGTMDADRLSSYSHEYPEWLAYKDQIEKEGTKSSYRIDMDLFFENNGVDDRGLFADDEEALMLAKEVYHEYHRA